MADNETLRIDIDEVVRQRLPRHYRYIPRFVISWLKRLIHQDELNEILAKTEAKDSVGAAEAVLEHLGITISNTGQIPTDGRFIFVSNHPLGGLDGLALISLLGRQFNGHIRFVVNDLLMALKPLRPIFLPVNKFGRQSRESATEIEAQYQGENQMITFPAGLCSRMGKGGKIADLDWQKFVVAQAVRTQRHIVPIYFDGENSKRFYRIAKWRKKLGIKFNFEMVLLPDEMFRARGKSFRIVVGKPIAWQSLNASQPKAEAARLKGITYALKRE